MVRNRFTGDASLHVVENIEHVRDGRGLTPAMAYATVSAYAAGRIGDAQMAALMMAIVFRGLEPATLAEWCAAMVESGDRLDWHGHPRYPIDGPVVDKHSTGGVGDKTSLIIAPLAACCGLFVPMLSGRGLGHTGGTLDKLEAITGYDVNLDADRLARVVSTVGCAIAAAGDRLAPADKRLYALRDITGTVPSREMIASSIMSKKIAEGCDALVLDVKVGSGAFLPGLDDARNLAATMIGLGEAWGVATAALLTDMSTPLGRAAGNAVEVHEAVDILEGRGPKDVTELSVALVKEMCVAAGLNVDVESELASGRPRERFAKMVTAHGGDLRGIARPSHVEYVHADRAGVLHLDAKGIGLLAWRLGAGRAKPGDFVDPAAGVLILAGDGENVIAGQPLLELHTSDSTRVDVARTAQAQALHIEDACAVAGTQSASRIIEIVRNSELSSTGLAPGATHV